MMIVLSVYLVLKEIYLFSWLTFWNTILPLMPHCAFELYSLFGSVSPLFAEALVEEDAYSYFAIIFQLIKNSGRIDCIEMGVVSIWSQP